MLAGLIALPALGVAATEQVRLVDVSSGRTTPVVWSEVVLLSLDNENSVYQVSFTVPRYEGSPRFLLIHGDRTWPVASWGRSPDRGTVSFKVEGTAIADVGRVSWRLLRDGAVQRLLGPLANAWGSGLLLPDPSGDRRGDGEERSQ